MNQKHAMTTLTGVLIILLMAATVSARDQVIVSKPVSADTAREHGSLNQMLSDSIHERAETESNFHAGGESARNDRDASVRAVQIDIGDELGGASGSGREIRPQVEHEYHMKAAAKELDGEWKEVNKDFKPLPRARVVVREASERRGSNGGSSASSMPNSRTQKSARAQSDDGLQN